MLSYSNFYLMLAVGVAAISLCLAQAGAGHGHDDAQRTNTCADVSVCIKNFQEARQQMGANHYDVEADMIAQLEAFAKKGQTFNNMPLCNALKMNLYLTKWRRIRVLKEDRYKRMEQCISRLNTWGRGFEPCAMPLEKVMPKTCSTPMDIMSKLMGVSSGSGVARISGRSGIWAMLADEKIGRTKRSVPAKMEADPFKAIEACLKDTCGCPEIEMCEKCYQLHSSHREMITLDQNLLYARWECGIQMKNEF
jgi:hypothetical protein